MSKKEVASLEGAWLLSSQSELNKKLLKSSDWLEKSRNRLTVCSLLRALFY